MINNLENIFLIYSSRITLDDEIKEKLKKLSANGLDWSGLVSKALRQGVGQFLYCHLSKIEGIWKLIPQEDKDELKRVYQTIVAGNWSRQLELKQVISLLDNAQIPVIVLKGAALLETVYKNIGLRYMSDIDLLIKKSDLALAKSILLEGGYQAPNNLDQQSLEIFGGEIYLYKRELFLDIHTDLAQYERFRPIFKVDASEEIWTKAKIHKRGEAQLRILDPVHQIIHLCLHHAINHSFAGLFRFCDLRQTILAYQGQIDWKDLIIKAKCYKIKTICYYALFLTQEMFGDILVEEKVLKALRPNKMQLFLINFFIGKDRILSLPDEEPGAKKYIAQLFLMDNLWDIPKIVFKSLFPSDEWLKYKYVLTNRFKILLYRLAHPLIFVLKMARG